MLSHIEVGFDPGNSETSVVITCANGEQKTHAIPSYVSRGSYDELVRFRTMSGGNHTTHPSEILRSKEYVLASGTAEFYVGELAVNQGRHATAARGDINRYWSPRALQLLLAAVGALIPDAGYEAHVVTGLPIETYSGQNRRKVRACLEGEHRYILNGHQRLAVVRVEKVIMEGAGAMIACGDDRSVRQAVIDIGGRTTDLYTADGQIPLVALCSGTALGVELAADLLNDKIQVQCGRTLTPREMRVILHATTGSGQYPPVFANGQELNPIDLRRWTEEALQSVGHDITTFLGQTWASGELGAVATDLARVLLVGGGAYYFYRNVATLIPHVVVPRHPEMANALGYAALTHHLRLRREEA
jgi:Actin like proteins N terminal domain/Archaeal actin homologue MreB-like, C-terminal